MTLGTHCHKSFGFNAVEIKISPTIITKGVYCPGCLDDALATEENKVKKWWQFWKGQVSKSSKSSK